MIKIVILVIAIGGILASILVFTDFVKNQKLARDSAKKDDLAKLSNIIEAYYSNHQLVLPAANGNSHISTDGSPPQNADGSGWIPADLSRQTASLLTDPVNNGQFFYRYYADPTPKSIRFKVDAAMEADYKAAASDGGIDPLRFEVGTDKTLLPP